MQKQEISNIMIFFVTQDLEGQPRQLEMHLMPEKEVSMMNQRFTEYLQRQREMYKPSLVQSHLPDLYLCRYQFPAGVSYPDIRLFDKDNSLVQKFSPGTEEACRAMSHCADWNTCILTMKKKACPCW